MLATLVLSSALLVSAQTEVELVDGAVSPPDTWYASGGNASRSARSSTAPVLGEPKEAWTYAPKGAVESEPIVWKDSVFLAVLLRDGRRAIEWIDLETGKRLGQKVFESSVLLQPSVWENVIALRTERTSISFFRLGNGKFTRFSTYDSEFEVSSPLLFRSEAYFCSGRSFIRFKPASSKIVWEKTGRYLDRPSLRGESVFAVRRQGDRLFLCEFNRTTGRRTRQMWLGDPDVDQLATEEIQVLDDSVFVTHANPIPYYGGRLVDATVFQSTNLKDADRGWANMKLGVIDSDEGWIGFFDDSLIVVSDLDGFVHIVLAGEDVHPEFMEAPVRLSRTDDTVLAGARAFRLETLEILWSLDVQPDFRAVPARNTLLLVVEGKLIAFRGAIPPPPRGHSLVEANDADPASSEVALGDVEVVLRDGTVHAGDFAIAQPADASSGPIVCTTRGKKRSWPLDEVVAIVGDDDRLKFAVEGDELELGLRALIRHRSAQGYADLAYESRVCRDLEVMRELVARARTLGSEDSRLVKVEKKIDDLERKPPSSIDSKKVQRVRDKQKSLAVLEQFPLWEFARHLDESAPEVIRLGLLRRALEGGDAPAEARERAWGIARGSLVGSDAEFLRDVLDRHEAEDESSKAEQWLDYVEVIQRHPVTFVAPSDSESSEGVLTDNRLRDAKSKWRRDLICVRSEHLRILTPVKEPGALARCIDVGEFICDVLADLFAEVATSKREGSPLYMHLYVGQDEYLAEVKKRNAGFADAATFTAGYYSPTENLQHIYLPADRFGFESVLGTYAHEITHNWIETQCPLFDPTKGSYDLKTAGAWIVEGFATFIDEFQFDLDAGTAEAWDPTAHSLDVLANARSDQLLSWGRFFRMSKSESNKLRSEDSRKVSMTWVMAVRPPISEARMFYEQGGATCRYLYFAEDGKHRRALLEYVGAFYSGRDDELDVKKAFGMTPETLGSTVVKFARDTIQR